MSDSVKLLPRISGPEIVFGLVGAIGTDLALIVEVLQEELREVSYNSKEIKLSGLLCQLCPELESLKDGPEDTRISELMRAGNELRKALKGGDALAAYSIAAIRDCRNKQLVTSETKNQKRFAYIINSLKHPSELQTLRRIYGRAFYSIAIYSPRGRRIDLLAEKIAKSKNGFDKDAQRASAETLIELDAKTVGDDFGQNVKDTFPQADIFIKMTQKEQLRKEVKRVVEIIFNHPFRTPHRDEFGMFHAKATALRSSDLSRQVGAVVMSDEGDILCVGCNEVPKATGGAVWEGDPQDYRDFQIGYDASARFKEEITAEIFENLKGAGWLNEQYASKTAKALANEALNTDKKPLKGTRLASIIEFGRIVHAEMSALMDAARRGISLKGATLYCTTFPCHMCARHIIAAGIKRVVYIEPYPKSLAKDLYKQSISVDEEQADQNAVSFDSFVGVAPTRYMEFFSMPETRKDKRGQAITWSHQDAEPRLDRITRTYIDVENSVIAFLNDKKSDLETFQQSFKLREPHA